MGKVVEGSGKVRAACLPRPFHRFVGFACIQAWLVCACLGRVACAEPVPLASLMTAAALPVCAGISISSATILALTLKVVPLCRRRALCVVAALVCCVCSALVSASTRAVLPESLFIPAAVVAGAAAGVQVLAWQEYYSTLGVRAAIPGMAVSSALGAAIFLVCELLPHPIGAIAFASLPLLGELTRRPPVGTRFFTSASEPISSRQLFSNMLHDYSPRMYVLCALVALAFSCGCTMTSPDLAVLAGPGGVFFVFLAGLVMCAASLAVLFMPPQHVIRLFYVALPLLMLDAAFVGWRIPGSGTPGMLLGACGVCLAYCLVWALMVSVAQGKRLATLGLIAFLHASCFLGVVAGQLFAHALEGDSARASVVMLVCLGTAALLFAGFNGKVTVSEEMFGAPQGNPVEQAVYALAQEFSLTPRELEVLQEWATGHNAAYIEDRLGISRNTVKTHLNHIYQKTGTAGREELLGLIDRHRNQAK